MALRRGRLEYMPSLERSQIPNVSERPVPPGLVPYWGHPVSEFATVDPAPLDRGAKERHRIFSLLLMSIVYNYWNGNKYGETGDYGSWRERQLAGETITGGHFYEGGTYQGHNIGALAVDGEGRVIDYDFNCNTIFDSSVEHAESRLVRRVFALNQIYEPWAALDSSLATARPRQARKVFATAVAGRADANANLSAVSRDYSTLLNDVTIYTSLESCAQCSGIMTLGSVKEIVYLQWDQGQFLIGNLMYNATANTKLGFQAPRPISGDKFDFEYFAELNQKNDEFSTAVRDRPFYTQGEVSVRTPSVTSFLCTDSARAIYATATVELNQWENLGVPDYVPPGALATAFSNSDILLEAKDFLKYVRELGNRGAPHRV
jgi:tRNA(Arg) A34 adenosine deaminase TadA